MSNQDKASSATELLRAKRAFQFEHPGTPDGEALRKVGAMPPAQPHEWTSGRIRVEAEELMAAENIPYGPALREIGRRVAAAKRKAEEAAFAERERRSPSPNERLQRQEQLIAEGVPAKQAFLTMWGRQPG